MKSYIWMMLSVVTCLSSFGRPFRPAYTEKKGTLNFGPDESSITIDLPSAVEIQKYA